MKMRKIFSYLLGLIYVVVISFFTLLNSSVLAAPVIPDDEIWLLVRGDDIGFCHGANLAFEESYKHGILTSAEVMVPPPWFNEAAKILNENPGLDVGVHLTLTSEWLIYRWGPVIPVNETGPGFVDEEGYFYYRTSPNHQYDKIFDSPYSFLESNPKLDEVERELRAQIELAMKKIPNITHVSCHMGAARATPELRELVGKLAYEYGLIPDWEFRECMQSTGNIFSVPPEEKESVLVSILENLEPGLWYFTCHPCLNTPETQAITSPAGDPDIRMALHRDAVAKAIISERVKQIIKEKNIKLVNHRDLIEYGLIKRN